MSGTKDKYGNGDGKVEGPRKPGLIIDVDGNSTAPDANAADEVILRRLRNLTWKKRGEEYVALINSDSVELFEAFFVRMADRLQNQGADKQLQALGEYDCRIHPVRVIGPGMGFEIRLSEADRQALEIPAIGFQL